MLIKRLSNLIIIFLLIPSLCFAAFPTTGVLDNFTGTNNVKLPDHDANWTNILLDNILFSNQAKGSATYQNRSLWEVAFGADSEVYVTLSTKGDTNSWIGLFIRMTTLVNSTTDGYSVYYMISAGTDALNLWRVDNGVTTQLGATVSDEIAQGDQFGIEVIGNTIQGYRGGISKISRDDSTYTVAGYIGIECGFDGGWTNFPHLDNFGGGTIVAPPAVTARPQVIFIGRQ
jgi:hypothetical protein